MKFHLLAAIIQEAATISPDEFTSRHPAPAFLIEPFTPGDRPATESHSSARICWIDVPAEGKIRFGRDAGVDVTIPHPRVSRTHATIQRLALGTARWLIEDNRSANGTVLRGKRLAPEGMVPISDGDRIVLGEAVTLRPFFEPATLRPFLATCVLVEPRREGSSRSSALELYERLARTFHSLGFKADVHEHVPELIIQTADGAERVRVARESGMYTVEWGTASIYVKRKTVSVFEAKVDEIVHQLVLEATTPAGMREDSARMRTVVGPPGDATRGSTRGTPVPGAGNTQSGRLRAIENLGKTSDSALKRGLDDTHSD